MTINGRFILFLPGLETSLPQQQMTRIITIKRESTTPAPPHSFWVLSTVHHIKISELSLTYKLLSNKA
jgi:hypothetical protein